MYGVFLVEAQPVMAIADHRGVIAPTVTGMLRLPVPIGLGLVGAWIEDFEPKPSAADEVVAPGPLRDEINSELRRKRKAA